MSSIWIRDNGKGHSVTVVPPNVWQGEVECVVGPFSSRSVAEIFIGFYDFGGFDVCERVFAYRDAWYVEVEPLPTPSEFAGQSVGLFVPKHGTS